MDDIDENGPVDGHQQEVYGMRNADFTTLVPTKVPQYVPIRQRQEIEQSRPAKPPVNTSTIRHELMHPGITEEDMFKDAVQQRKKREEEYKDEIDRNRNLARKTGFDAPKQQAGICTQMCPRWDRLRRANNKSAISTYEVDENGYFGETRAVKSFHRPAAGDVEDLPEDLRTEDTLITTLDYLVHNIIGRWSYIACQNFVWDRTRSIRQDCSIQGLNSDAVIESYERIARFHIFSLQQLSHNESFQRGQEFEQLSKTLISLNELYDDRRRMIKQGLRPYKPEADFEAEFRAYTLVSNLHSPLQLARALQLPPRIIETPIFRIAIMLFKYAQRANHDDKNLFGNTARSEATLNWSAQFFDLIHDISTPYLLACLAATEFPNVKKGAIKTFERGFPPQKKAANLTVLKELVDASQEQDVKSLAERFGLKTTEHNGVLYMDCPRKSQPSTWIANPSPICPPFPLMVEGKRGQDLNGEFIAARFFIDEPGCYRRVISQLYEEEVDIRYHDPIQHEPTPGGPVHIVSFASSWESVGSFVHDLSDVVEDDSAADGLFDLIRMTRNGIVPAAQANNLVTYVGQRKRPVKRGFAPARPTTVATAPQQTQQQRAPQFKGFPKAPTPQIAGSTQSVNLQVQSNAPVAPSAPSAFPAAFPPQQSAPSFPTAPTPVVASAFGKPNVVSAFGAPVPAFGSKPPGAQPVPAFGAKVGSNAPTAPAFGPKPAAPASAFGPKPGDTPSAFVSAFGPKPAASDNASAFKTGSPSLGTTPPTVSVFPPATSVFQPAGQPSSVFASQNRFEDLGPQTEKPSEKSIFDARPDAPASIFDQQPKQPASVFDTKPTPATSIFNEPPKPPQSSTPATLFSDLNQQPAASTSFPQAFPSFNPNATAFVPAQTSNESKPVASIFDQPKPPSVPVQEPGQSVFDLEPAREKVTSFFSTTTPAPKPSVPTFPSTFFPPAAAQFQPAQSSIFDPKPPTVAGGVFKSAIAQQQESPFTLEESTPKIPSPPEVESPVQPEPIQAADTKPKSPGSELALSKLDTEVESEENAVASPREITDIKSVIQPIDPAFIRKVDKSRHPPEPWYPGINWINTIHGVDIWTLAEHQKNLKALAWRKLTLSDCKPEGLPKLLFRKEPNLWHLQLVCADVKKLSLNWFMNKFQGLVRKEGKETYQDTYVASSQMRGQDGNIGGLIFGCTAVTKEMGIKETKQALKHDKDILRRSVTNAIQDAPRGKLELLVLAYQGLGGTKKAELENLRKDLGIDELETNGNLKARILVLEEPKDLEKLHSIIKKFGVRKKGEEEELVEAPPSSSNQAIGSPKKRELTIEDLEMRTAGLGLGTESKRRRFGAVEKQPYVYGLPAFEKTPVKKVQKPQPKPQSPVLVVATKTEEPKRTPIKRKIMAESNGSEKKKREVQRAEIKISKAITSVSQKFDKWALPDDEEDFLLANMEFMKEK